MIVDIVEDRNGILWVATTGKGLLQRTPDGVWKDLTVHNAGLPSNEITCLMPSEKGMCAATRNGLVVLGEETEIHLEGMDIQYLTDDGTQLWLTTPSSLIRFVPGSDTWEQFGASDGIRSGQFLPGSGLTAREGKIYLGATDGVVSFFPGGVVENRIPPTVLFTRFHALGPGMDEDVLRTQGTDDIRISWRKRDLRFSFAALSFCAPEKVRYAYRLEGLDPHWKMLGNQNLLSLDQVPAGHYRLQVIACNNSGVWNQEGASLSFTIRNHPLPGSASSGNWTRRSPRSRKKSGTTATSSSPPWPTSWRPRSPASVPSWSGSTAVRRRCRTSGERLRSSKRITGC